MILAFKVESFYTFLAYFFYSTIFQFLGQYVYASKNFFTRLARYIDLWREAASFLEYFYMKTTPTPSTNLHLIYFANCGKYSELIDGSEKSGFLVKIFLYAVQNKEETNHIQLFCLKTILLGLFYSGRPKKLGRVLGITVYNTTRSNY